MWTPESVALRPERDAFFGGKMRVKQETLRGITLEQMLARMDAAGIERAFLIATKVGRLGHPACYHIPYRMVADAVARYPKRFHALAGLDPTEGMAGVRAFESAVRDDGFIGGHFYPHWYELAPDHAKWYPFYAKCVELDVPVQLQVGQSMIYDPTYPLRSVGRPITLDAVACDFPELKLVGIHVGIPWTDEMIAMAWKHPNVYIGSDAHSPKYWPESFVRYIDSFGQDKVIFGTDFPVLDFERTRAEIEALGLQARVEAQVPSRQRAAPLQARLTHGMIALEITPELAEVRAAMRRFAIERLEPIAEEIDRTGEVPAAAIAALRDQGYLGMRLPAEYGGGDFDLATYCLALEEFARSHRVFTLLLDATSGLTPIAIARAGTIEQKRKYVPGLAAGSMTASFALTEPEAGSDSAAIRTRAVRGDGGWILNGRKQYISGAHRADVVLVIAVTDPARRARGGITAFLVDRGTPGFTVTRVDTTIGSEAIKLADLAFDDCFVPDAAVLGEVGAGFGIAMGSLTSGRLGVSCSCIGAADRLLEMSVAHAKARHTFGKPLAERQAIQWMLADSATELAAARALVYETLRQASAGAEPSVAGGMCKLYASEMVGRVADRAVQIHGGMGLVRGFPVERFYRDVRHYRVGEGASEIQRMLIARDLLG